MKIKAVAFDIDGTLYPNSMMYFLSIPFLLSHIKEVRAFANVRKRIRKVEEIPDFYKIQGQLMGEKLGISTEESVALIDELFYTRWFKVFDYLKPFHYVKECLEELQNRGILLGAMSDFPLRDRLDRLGLKKYFPVRFSTEEIGYLKPRVEPFLALQERLGVDPQNILYVGNSYAYDVLGARKAGMLAAYLVRRPGKDGHADLSFFGYKKLTEWILERS